MQGVRAILLLSSVAATSLVPPQGLLQEPAPPDRFPIPYIEVCPVSAHRLVVYRGPRSGMSPGQHQEFVLEQGGGLSFHSRDETQTVGTVTRMNVAHLDPLGLVTEYFGSVEEAKVLCRPAMIIRDVGNGVALAEEEVIRVLLMMDGQVVLQSEVTLVTPYSGSHANAMAAVVNLWDVLFTQVLEANQRTRKEQPPSLEKAMSDWEAKWREEAMAEMKEKRNMR